MPKINPDKGFIQLPVKQYKLDTSIPIPADWLTKLGSLIADDILHLDDTQKLYPNDEDPVKREFTQKTEFFYHLNRHAGPASTYSFKAPLHESLQTLYSVLADPKTPPDQKYSLAVKIVEGAPNCTPGFHDRCNECIQSLTQPENLDEVLGVIRQSMVSTAANQTTDETHAYNRFFVVARNLGYGVRPLNLADIHQGNIGDQTIRKKIEEVFASHYTIFNALNSLVEQLQSIVRLCGYNGRRDVGYAYEDYSKFNSDYFKPFIGDILDYQLFEYRYREEDDLVPIVVDINWREIKKSLLNKLKSEHYFIFSPAEEALLAAMIEDDASLSVITPESLVLVPTLDELLRCLTFFTEYSSEKKAALVLAYLNGKSEAEQKAVLDQLEKIPDLGKALQSVPTFHPLYSAYLQSELLIAAKADQFDRVKMLVARGADVNAVLGLLMIDHKAETMSDSTIRAAINPAGLSAILLEGAHQGKTVAEVWVNSKRGRYWLLEDKRLQALFPESISGQSKATWLTQALAEKPTQNLRLFLPENPLVKPFLRDVVDGKKEEVEKRLKDNPEMQQMLLTSNAKVKDYAGRKIKGTALAIALGAKDVSIGEHEEMAEMLERYLKRLRDGEAEIEKQKAAKFQAGLSNKRKHVEKQILSRLKKYLKKLKLSTNEAASDAAVMEFKDYLAKQKDRVIKTGYHFNDQLFAEALDLYDSHYEQFGGYDSPKNRLAAVKVIGGIECLFTANLAQAACDGFGKVVDNKARLSRSLKLEYPAGFPFFHPDLGGSHFVYSYYGRGAWGAMWWASRRAGGGVRFKTYVEQKHQTCKTYAACSPASSITMVCNNVV